MKMSANLERYGELLPQLQRSLIHSMDLMNEIHELLREQPGDPRQTKRRKVDHKAVESRGNQTHTEEIVDDSEQEEVVLLTVPYQIRIDDFLDVQSKDWKKNDKLMNKVAKSCLKIMKQGAIDSEAYNKGEEDPNAVPGGRLNNSNEELVINVDEERRYMNEGTYSSSLSDSQPMLFTPPSQSSRRERRRKGEKSRRKHRKKKDTGEGV